MSTVPLNHRALVFDFVSKTLAGVRIQRRPTLQVETGSAIVQILSAGVLSYQRDIYNGTREYPLPRPLVGGMSAIGRVIAVGRDAVMLEPGMLVYVDCVLRGRDDVDAMILSANSDGFSQSAKKLMKDVWRDGVFAEFVRWPLESLVALDEKKLCYDLGYGIEQLTYISYMLVAMGGLRDIKLESHETLVICPATGGFGGAGVQVAVAMGAKVIAMGRNEEELARLQAHVLGGTPYASVETVKITGDEAVDLLALQKLGPIDAALDLSPPGAADSPYLNSVIKALRIKGRISLMGGFWDGPIPSFPLIAKDITVKGKFMYDREDMFALVKMLERKMFPTGNAFVDIKKFTLDEWTVALNTATEHVGVGRFVVITP